MVLRKPDIRIGVIIGLIARDSFELGNIWREVHRELKLEELWDGKIEELKKEKRTLKTSITKLLNELSTKTPKKENVTAKMQDIDKRRDELFELLDSLQTLYGENEHASLATSTGDEADKMIDRVDNETKEARLFLSQSNSEESEGNNTSQIGTFESAHGKDGYVAMKTNSSSGFESQSFRATKKNISRGGQCFPVVWMKQICQLSLKCCGSKVV